MVELRGGRARAAERRGIIYKALGLRGCGRRAWHTAAAESPCVIQASAVGTARYCYTRSWLGGGAGGRLVMCVFD